MGLHSGSVTLTRYRLLGAKNFSLTDLNQELPRYQAKKIKLGGVRVAEKALWSMPISPEVEDIPIDGHWDMSHCQFDNGFILRMRIEKRNVSSELAALIYRGRLDDLEHSKKRPLGRKEKRELKEEIKIELLEKSLPNISYTDIYWDAADQQIILFTASKKIQTLFEELFKKTFSDPLNTMLVKIEPPLLGLSVQEWTGKSKDTGIVDRLLKTTPVTYSISQHN